MKNLIVAILLLSPAFVHAEVLPTRSLEPVIRVSEDIIYVTDKKGNDWAVETSCKIKSNEVTRFTVRGKSLRIGRQIKLNDQKYCEIKTIQAI